MEKNELFALHRAEYHVLCELDDICNQLGIRCILSFGTLLGAIRHNGFIPWDDDVDVIMRYQDYKKLRRYFKKHGNNVGDIFLADYTTDHETVHCLPRVRLNGSSVEELWMEKIHVHTGVWNDIFTYCYYAKNKTFQKLQWYLRGVVFMMHEKYRNRVKRSNGIDVENVAIYRIIEKMPEPIRIASMRFLLGLIAALGSKRSGKYFCMCMHVTTSNVLPRHILEETDRHIFEDREFYVPKATENFLVFLFGPNYMTPIDDHRRMNYDSLVLPEQFYEKES